MQIHTDPRERLLEQVCEGMAVFDSAGERLGKVDFVKLGDPEAVTTQGNEPTSTTTPGLGIVAVPAPILPVPVAVPPLGGEGPDVPEPRRSHLLRMGYLRVDESGLMSGHRYVAADEVAAVQGEEVRLAPEQARVAPGESSAPSTTPPAPATGTTTVYRPVHRETPVQPVPETPAPERRESRRPWPVFALAAAGPMALAGLVTAFLRWRRRRRQRPIDRLRMRVVEAAGRMDRRAGGGAGAVGLLLLALLRARLARGARVAVDEQPVAAESRGGWSIRKVRVREARAA